MSELAAFHADPSQEQGPLSNSLVTEHRGLVRRIARKVDRSSGASIDLEELVQTGMLALVQASRAFVQRGEATFATYATMRVRGAMIDVLRSSATINRGAMRRRKKLKETEAALAGRLGRTPSSGELAVEMGLSAADYRSVIDEAQPVYLEPLDAVYSDRSAAFASEECDALAVLERENLRDALAQAIARLPQREALVLHLYFIEELTLDEIGQTLEVGAARVCQIKKQAVDRLRAKLGPVWG